MFKQLSRVIPQLSSSALRTSRVGGLMGLGLIATLAVGCGGAEFENQEPSQQQGEQVPEGTRESLANTCTFKYSTNPTYSCNWFNTACQHGQSYYTYNDVYRCCEAGICYDEYISHRVDQSSCC